MDSRDAKFCVSTEATEQVWTPIQKFGIFVIRGYKIGVKKWSTMNNMSFAWQPRFYEHIIRDEDELHEVREYIANNPINWPNDEENQDNTKG